MSFGATVIAKLRSLGNLFLFCVFVPLVLAVIYFGLISPDIYVSEAKFVVRSPERPAPTTLGFLLKSAGFSNSNSEMSVAQDFVMSRDALHAINKDDYYRKAVASKDISWLDRFGTLITGDTFEDLFRFYKKAVHVDYDSGTSISTLTVRAFTPQDAQRVNRELLELAEGMVNRLNERGRKDLINYATTEVENAKQRARDAALALSAFRNRERIVDPSKQAGVQLQMISKLQDELISNRTALLELRTFAPQNPQIALLEARAAALSGEIKDEMDKVSGSSGSLSSASVQFERLSLESQFADKQLATAMASLEEALSEARRKQAYVERIANSSLPDDAQEPKRIKGILSTFVLGLVAWGVLSMLLAAVREHRD